MEDGSWRPAAGTGTVYTYSVVHSNDLPPFNERVPYVAAIVELDEGPRVMTDIEGVTPDAVEIGMRVSVDFRPISDDITIPVFRPV
ncbi:MAG: Zn-ribbon domain-containing OB-fold protein, partial [Actinomycetota bacterium]